MAKKSENARATEIKASHAVFISVMQGRGGFNVVQKAAVVRILGNSLKAGASHATINYQLSTIIDAAS